MSLQIPPTKTVTTMNALDLRNAIEKFVKERVKHYAQKDKVYRESVHRLSESMPREVLGSVTHDILGEGHSNGSYSYFTDEGFHENYWNASFVGRDSNGVTFSAIEKDDFVDEKENLTLEGVFYVVNVTEYDYEQVRPQRLVKSYHIPVEVLLELQHELYNIPSDVMLLWSW